MVAYGVDPMDGHEPPVAAMRHTWKPVGVSVPAAGVKAQVKLFECTACPKADTAQRNSMVKRVIRFIKILVFSEQLRG
jgi:hypothetical protein